MEEKNKRKLTAPTVITFVIVFAFAIIRRKSLSYGIFAINLFCDAFTLAGAVNLFISYIKLGISKGYLSGLEYIANKAVMFLLPFGGHNNSESYSEFVEKRNSKRKAEKNLFLPVALVDFAIAAILLLIYYIL